MGRNTFNIDWITFLILACIAFFGLFILLSVEPALAYQQGAFLLFGILILVGCSRIDRTILWWIAPVFYVVSNMLLAVSYLGPAIRGATRWILVFGVQIQPSEVVKPLLLIAFARFMMQFPPRNIRTIPFHIFLITIPLLLVFRQPDLGTSIVYLSFWLAMMLGAGLRLRTLFAVSGIGSLLIPALWRVLAPYQKSRIETFFNPALDPKGAGYNALQALIAVGSGQLFGRGLGRGTQSHLRFLPEFHTDFIFATIIEELGFLGGILLLAAYAVLLWRTITPLLKGTVTHVFPFVYSVGLMMMMLTQIFINAGMNMGIIPVTGITLPFVSYGGSSILSLCISFGFLWALQHGDEDEERASIAIR